MKFTKMHGLGNDYIYLNCLNCMPDDPSALAKALSDRHFGIGGDGLICICSSEFADFRMRMFNADGSEGAMCGNGIRCVGKYAYDKGLTDKTELTIETASGMKHLTLYTGQGKVTSAAVDMGVPEIGGITKIAVKEITYTGVEVSVGNPHFVVAVPDVNAVDVVCIGPLIERHPRFPGGVNVEFVQVLGHDRFKMRVWERGSGETLACGTGACAAAAVLANAGKIGRRVTACLPGGDLEILWRQWDDHLLMIGPAVTVFEGEWYGEGQ